MRLRLRTEFQNGGDGVRLTRKIVISGAERKIDGESEERGQSIRVSAYDTQGGDILAIFWLILWLYCGRRVQG
jgi:hypothetical protein